MNGQRCGPLLTWQIIIPPKTYRVAKIAKRDPWHRLLSRLQEAETQRKVNWKSFASRFPIFLLRPYSFLRPPEFPYCFPPRRRRQRYASAKFNALCLTFLTTMYRVQARSAFKRDSREETIFPRYSPSSNSRTFPVTTRWKATILS